MLKVTARFVGQDMGRVWSHVVPLYGRRMECSAAVLAAVAIHLAS